MPPDVFGDDLNDELDIKPDELIVGDDPEEDFGDVDSGDEPEPEPSKPDPDPEPERRHEETIDASAQARQTADLWAAEVERRESAYADAKAALEAAETAYENGEPGDANTRAGKIAAMERLTDARYDLRQAQETHHKAVEYVQTANPARDAWTAANQRIVNDPKYLAEANGVFKELADSGMDPRHPGFYRELDKRLKRTPAMNRNGRTSGAPVTAGAQRPGADQQQLTDQDKQQLRDWGLVTPGMPKEKRISVAKEYLRQKTIARHERRV